MKRVILREIIEEPRDIKYEIFRALKTFCLILIIFLLGFFLKKNYFGMMENSRNMRFYPVSTVFYIDGIDGKSLVKDLGINGEFTLSSYGIFKDAYGKDKILAVLASGDAEESPIIKKGEYSVLTSNGYTFISNSEDEITEIKKRISRKHYEFLKNRNIKKMLKTLDVDRTKTIIAGDISYIGIEINPDARKAINKIFDKAVIQTFENDKEVTFSGEVSFKNKVADAALNVKKVSENFLKEDIKIEQFKNENPVLIIGVKDFDLWSKTFVKILKTLPDNQYNNTLKLIQTVFNFDIEEDIVKQLNGSAVFYMYSQKHALHPMLLLETKKDLAEQGKKYLNFLQLTNSSKLSEKQVNDKTFNVLSSGLYPYNLSFGSIDDSMFILGHQNIIEKYLKENNTKVKEEKCDIYVYSDIKKLFALSKNKRNKSFWRNYKNIELKLFVSPNITFSGKLDK